MTLDNLLGISLERVEPDLLRIKRLLEAAQRNIQDAELEVLTNENRFDVAHKAIMQMANAALQSCGYRTLTSKPGHQQTMIQSLPKTIGLDTSTMRVLDALRKQRNVINYSGDLVTDGMVHECINHARSLSIAVSDWLETRQPELLKRRSWPVQEVTGSGL